MPAMRLRFDMRSFAQRGTGALRQLVVIFLRRNSITSAFVASSPRLRSDAVGKGILLWLLGIPIPVIILLYVFHVV